MTKPLSCVLLLAACASQSTPRTARTTGAMAPSAQASSEVRFAAREVATQVTCPGAALRGDGQLVCPDEAKAQGLTIVDLGDQWTPRLFAPQPDGTAPNFRATYLAMSNDKGLDGKPLPHEDELAELYGVVPSLAIARARLADDARHACHAAIDPAPILQLDKPYAQDHKDQIAAASATRKVLEKQLEAIRVKRGAADFAALADVPQYARWKKADDLHRGLVAAQQRLVCEKFLAEKDADGSMTWRTSNAVELFQRRNFLMPNERLDPETRDAMQLDSRELDFRLALRILRERVVDATGLIEDGTAGDGPQPVLGRLLDPAPMRAARGVEKPLPDGAPDLISAATEAAAKELGWTGPAELKAFFERHPNGLRVALALPPVPAYHSAHMELSTVIDRGDVWYDDRPIARKIKHRPTLVLYVTDGATKRPLVRWPTTIGGWSDVRLEGGFVVQKWKESDVGPRVWKELYAAPTWLPPPSTPDRDLVKNNYNGTWSLKTDIMGPGPHAAFGVALLKHHRVVKLKDGTERFDDNGIGTHGSASVTSIVNGTSHGCHRLYNQLAVRLADFLLVHRNHEVKGETPEVYRRIVRHKGTFVAKINTRGYLYEMTPPVPVVVKAGNIKSARKVPPRDSAPARPD
ncbi:MAG: L,D-transpeptidase family protein [Myxococcales bacterium]|nr:L,D-transpeptidase family protein [Myxococcales bacterium]